MEKTYSLLEQWLSQSSREFQFEYALVNMRDIMQRFHQNQQEFNLTLSPVELKLLAEFTMPKKKIQWIAGRLAVKTALFKYKAEQETILDLQCIDILNGINLAPHLVQFPEIQVSITHSFPYCIGVVAGNSIGVDLERIFIPRDAFIEYYFHPREMQTLALKKGTEDYNVQATAYWTRKEAISKLLGLGMQMNFQQTDTVGDSLVLNQYRSNLIRLKSFVVTDYCFSVALEGSVIN